MADRVASPPEYAGDYTEGLAYLPGTLYLADHLRSWHTRRLASPDALPAVTKQQVCPARRDQAAGLPCPAPLPDSRGRDAPAADTRQQYTQLMHRLLAHASSTLS